MAIPSRALNDGRMIPQLGFGVWKVPADETERIVLDAFEAGYRHIDTASLYRNEDAVGAAVRASGLRREEVFVTTKLWNTEHVEGRAREGFHASLERLGLDYVDLYLIHWPRPDADRYIQAWEALIELREAGLARSIGVSNFTPALLERLIAETGVVPAVDQVELHPGYAQRPLRDWAFAQGVAVECWGPLGQGKYPLFEYPAVVSAAAAHAATPAQIVLAWHLAHDLVPLPKTVSAARMVENAGAAELRLTADEIAAIDALDAGLRLGADPERDRF